MKKIILPIMMTLSIFLTGCSIPFMDKTTVMADGTTIKTTTNSTLIGGWKGEVGLSAAIFYFENDKDVTVATNGEPTYTGLYELEDLGKDTYKVHIYSIGKVGADTSDHPGVSKGKEVNTLIFNIKDKNTIEMGKEGVTQIMRLERIEPALVKKLLGL
jgi:hypothetical protein